MKEYKVLRMHAGIENTTWYSSRSGRKKELFGALRRHLGEVFRELAKHKEWKW